MQAIEFQTTLGNDGLIRVPQSVTPGNFRGKVRVLILTEEPAAPPGKKENFIDYLLANPVKVDKSIRFLMREEIYDRNL